MRSGTKGRMALPSVVELTQRPGAKGKVERVGLHHMTVPQRPCARERRVHRAREVDCEVLSSKAGGEGTVTSGTAADLQSDSIREQCPRLEPGRKPVRKIDRVIVSRPRPFVSKGLLRLSLERRN